MEQEEDENSDGSDDGEDLAAAKERQDAFGKFNSVVNTDGETDTNDRRCCWRVVEMCRFKTSLLDRFTAEEPGKYDKFLDYGSQIVQYF